MGFKGANLRSAMSLNKLKNMTILEIISVSSYKDEFFKILEKIVPRGDTSGFGKFREILLLVVERRYINLIDRVPDLMQFITIGHSHKLDDVVAFVKMTIIFLAFNQLSEAQLT